MLQMRPAPLYILERETLMTESNEITEQTMDLLTIPAQHVRQGYSANVNVETILWGDELVEGMVVLIADPTFRENEERINIASDYELSYIRPRYDEQNRWCRVSKIRARNDVMSFVGLYADGTQRTRTYNVVHAWAVKLESIS